MLMFIQQNSAPVQHMRRSSS